MCMLIFVVYQFVSPCTFNVFGFWVIRNRFLFSTIHSPSTFSTTACHCYSQSFIHFICNMVFFFLLPSKVQFHSTNVFEANEPREKSCSVCVSCILFGSTVRPNKEKLLQAHNKWMQRYGKLSSVEWCKQIRNVLKRRIDGFNNKILI